MRVHAAVQIKAERPSGESLEAPRGFRRHVYLFDKGKTPSHDTIDYILKQEKLKAVMVLTFKLWL
jgi:hypothetical protein